MSSSIRYNKRKTPNECFAQSVFYPNPTTPSPDAPIDSASSRKTPRTGDASPSQLPPTAHPKWPPGRITHRKQGPPDLVKVQRGLPPVSRWEALVNHQQDHQYSYRMNEDPSVPSSSLVSYTNLPTPAGIQVNGNGQLTPPRESLAYSDSRQEWWTPQTRSNMTLSNQFANSSSNALGLFHGSPAVPLPQAPQSEITRWIESPQTQTSQLVMNSSLDNLLQLLDTDFQTEVLNHLRPETKHCSPQLWSGEELEREVTMDQDEEEDRQPEETSFQSAATGPRRGSTSELCGSVTARVLAQCYTMPNLSVDLPIPECPSPEMARSETPSPIQRSPTPSPLYRMPASSPLVDPYYTGEDDMPELELRRPIDEQAPAEPAPIAPTSTRRFWRDDLSTPGSGALSNASGSNNPSPLSQFIRDLPNVPDYDNDNAPDPYPSLSRALADTNIYEEEYELDEYDYDNDVSDDEYFTNEKASEVPAERRHSEPGYHSSEASGLQEPNEVKLSQHAYLYLEGRILHPDFAAKYDIIDEIGSGGFGFVCAALGQDGTEVAVKFVFKCRSRDAPVLSMTGDQPTEAYLLDQLNHPNIISLIDYYEDRDFYYLVQELHGDPWKRPRMYAKHLSGDAPLADNPELAEIRVATRVQVGSSTPGASSSTPALSPSTTASPFTPFQRPGMLRRTSYDLFEAIEHNRFGETESRYIFRQLVDAVHYMHENCVYHRDLKDENIVIDRHLQVKIIDFGSAIVEDQDAAPVKYTQFTGTAIYAPPEVCPDGKEIYARRGYLAAPADIWCLGLILGMLLSGKSPAEVSHSARHNKLRLRSRCTHAAYNIVESCLRTDPKERATIYEIANHPWLTDVRMN